MQKKKINTILIGLGKIGFGYDFLIPYQIDKPNSSKKIITHARAISCHPSYNFIAAIDNNFDACKKFNSVYRNPTFKDIDCFLNKVKINIDFVIIAVSPQNQPKLIIEVIQKINPKALLIEKPIAISMEETIKIQSLCKSKSELFVCVNYGRTYLPLVQNWTKKITSGELGNFICGQIIYGKGLITNGSHFLHLAQHWLGKLKHIKTLNNGLKFDDFDREISFILGSKNKDSFIGVYSIGYKNMRAGELDLWFEGGRICWKNNGESILFWPRVSPNSPLETYDILSDTPEIFLIDNSKSQYYVLNAIQNIFNNKNGNIVLPCSLDDCVETMKLMNKALSSEIRNE